MPQEKQSLKKVFVGSICHTKDGRRVGNGIVVQMRIVSSSRNCNVSNYSIKVETDFGNFLTLTLPEFFNLFHKPTMRQNYEEWTTDRLLNVREL